MDEWFIDPAAYKYTKKVENVQPTSLVNDTYLNIASKLLQHIEQVYILNKIVGFPSKEPNSNQELNEQTWNH